jgi:energy-coupling factor transport system ATP-binding protein
MLDIKNLSISYPSGKVLGNINLHIERNETLGIVGGNGSGKSTLAYYLAGLIPEFINARVSGKMPGGINAGLIMQSPASQFFGLSVADEISREAISQFGLEGIANSSVYELSEGQKQKVNLLANISNRPDLLLLDEPLELLDPYEARDFRGVLNGITSTKIWFDKSDEKISRSERMHYLQKIPAAKTVKKQERELGGKIFECDFSFRNEWFSLKGGLSIRENEKIALIGKNGSGKTTLLKIFAGMLKVNGKISAARVSYSPQMPSHQLFEDCVRDEITCMENIRKFGLEKIENMAPTTLSKGQQKMVSIAALAPGTLQLLDEPTTWLDMANKNTVLDFINESRDTMAIATHDPDIVELADRVLLVNDGEVRECSSTTAKRFFRAQTLA